MTGILSVSFTSEQWSEMDQSTKQTAATLLKESIAVNHPHSITVKVQ